MVSRTTVVGTVVGQWSWEKWASPRRTHSGLAKVNPHCTWSVYHPTSQRWSLNPGGGGGDSRSPSHPMHDVHRARMTKGVG